MKINLLLKDLSARGFIILFIFVTVMNSILVFSHNTKYLNVDENNYIQLNSQAINILPETNGTKVHLKLLTESFSGKFYSYEYCIKKLGNHYKILTIISEIISEPNLRNSSFLIAELTTST